MAVSKCPKKTTSCLIIKNPLHLNSQLVKVDLATCEEQVWWEEDKLVSEPVFIAAPGASEEDQGVVLSAILDKVKHIISYIVWNDVFCFINVSH